MPALAPTLTIYYVASMQEFLRCLISQRVSHTQRTKEMQTKSKNSGKQRQLRFLARARAECSAQPTRRMRNRRALGAWRCARERECCIVTGDAVGCCCLGLLRLHLRTYTHAFMHVYVRTYCPNKQQQNNKVKRCKVGKHKLRYIFTRTSTHTHTHMGVFKCTR